MIYVVSDQNHNSLLCSEKDLRNSRLGKFGILPTWGNLKASPKDQQPVFSPTNCEEPWTAAPPTSTAPARHSTLFQPSRIASNPGLLSQHCSNSALSSSAKTPGTLMLDVAFKWNLKGLLLWRTKEEGHRWADPFYKIPAFKCFPSSRWRYWKVAQLMRCWWGGQHHHEHDHHHHHNHSHQISLSWSWYNCHLLEGV